jgi:hypothetical protein
MPIQLLPLVIPLGRPARLTVQHLAPGSRYAIQVRSRRQVTPDLECELSADDAGCLRIEGTYALAGEYTVDIAAPSSGARLARLGFFVASPDLFARRPLRADFHIHTRYSDGRNSPAEMVIRGRELGLDVLVITDHNNYAGATEAVAERARLGLNLVDMPGEEVTTPTWHIVAVNADTGIHDRMLEAFGLVGADKPTVDARLSEYDALCWAIRATQAHGGRAYLAHPYWAVDRGFNMPTALYDRILEEGILDGLELIGEVKYEDNVRSLARYLDLRAAGRTLPIVGNSDTHGAQHTYGLYWTLVFATEPSPAGVLQAIAEGWSVACTTVAPTAPANTALTGRAASMQAWGSFELVDYAYFLEEHFFPMHDALCVEEAALAYRAWRGDHLPDGTMAACQADMAALVARCWGGSSTQGRP